MSKINNGGLDQYGAEPFEQQQFGTASDRYTDRIYTTKDDDTIITNGLCSEIIMPKNLSKQVSAT